jgi:hypothetical protein
VKQCLINTFKADFCSSSIRLGAGAGVAAGASAGGAWLRIDGAGPPNVIGAFTELAVEISDFGLLTNELGVCSGEAPLAA